MASVLVQRGEKVLLLDNLANSSLRVLDRMEQFSGKRPVFVEGDIRDRALLQKVCREQAVGAVIHFAGLKVVGEEEAEPLRYYETREDAACSGECLWANQAEDAKDVCGLSLLPPDINFSEYRFRPVSRGDGQSVKEIRYGLGAVRGSGEAAIESVVQARKAGPFTDLFDFCARIDWRQVNRRTIDALSQGEGC